MGATSRLCVQPTYEMLPFDEFNQVPLIYKIKPNAPLLLAHPYPCVVDPTRRMANVSRFYEFDRDEIEMHHFSFVRAGAMHCPARCREGSLIIFVRLQCERS